MHSPDVTTSVSSSVQCGFSGGMRHTLPVAPRTDRDRARPGGWVPSSGARTVEVERYRVLAEERLGRTIASVALDRRVVPQGRGRRARCSSRSLVGRTVHRRPADRQAAAAGRGRRAGGRGPVRDDRHRCWSTAMTPSVSSCTRPPERPGVGPVVGDLRRRRADGGARPPAAGRSVARSRRVPSGPGCRDCRRRRAGCGAVRFVGPLKATSARPVPARRSRQPHRRRGAVAGRACSPSDRPARCRPPRCGGCTVTCVGRWPT